jgi:hypothetical protein
MHYMFCPFWSAGRRDVRVILIKKWISLVVLTVIVNNLISSKFAALCVATTHVRHFFILGRIRESERELGCRKSGRMGVGCVCVCVCVCVSCWWEQRVSEIPLGVVSGHFQPSTNIQLRPLKAQSKQNSTEYAVVPMQANSCSCRHVWGR